MEIIKVNPLVSVLMTAYNREKFIADAIESVIASTYQNWELIIVDDHSIDRTLEISKSYEILHPQIRVYSNEVNLGDYPNRNKAASYAKGKYIKYVDADDMIYPWGLEIMVSCMEKFPLAGFGLSSKQINEKIFPVCLSPREIYLEHYAGYYHFDRAPGSSIILTDVFNSIGGFSGKRLIGDYEFWFKISRVYPMVKLPVDMYWNRIHLGQESKSLSALDYQMLRCNIEKEALKDPLCPLTKKEIDRIKIRQFKNTLRQYIKF